MNLLNPQLVLHFNTQEEIVTTKFLTNLPDDELKETHSYKIFTHLLNNPKYKFVSSSYEIIKSHILLTLTIDEVRGFVRNLLNIKSPILIFSLWNNIDYKSPQGIFNPFDGSIPIKMNNIPIIDIYKGVASLGIFCLLESETLGTEGIFRQDVFDFVERIKDVNKDDFIKNIETKNEHRCNLEITPAVIQSISDFPVNTTINLYVNNNIYLSNVLRVIDDKVAEHSLIKFWVPSEDDSYDSSHKPSDTLGTNPTHDIATIKDGKCEIHNERMFETYILSNDKNLIFEKRTIVRSKYLVNLDIFIKSVFLEWNQYDFLLNISNQDKINIFFDRSKSTTIILTKKKITFITHSMRIDYIKYLTYILITIFDLEGQVENIKRDIKSGQLYFSRFCQGKRKAERVVLRGDLPDDNFKLKSNGLYEDPNGHQRFFDKENNTIYTCNNNTYKKIGVSKAIIYAFGFCLYCCFKKVKETGLIRHCLDGTQIQIEIDPYIKGVKGYKFLVDPGQIGLLHGKESKFFNNRSLEYEANILTTSKHSNKTFNARTIFKQKMSDYTISFDVGDYKTKATRIEFENTILCITNNSIIDEDVNHDLEILPKMYLALPSARISNSPSSKDHKIYQLLSSLNNFIVLNKSGRVTLAKNIVVYTSNPFEDDVVTKLDVENRNAIFLINGEVCFSNKLMRLYQQKLLLVDDISIFLVNNKKVHNLKVINKLPHEDIVITDLTPERKKEFFDKILDVKPFKFSYEHDKFLFNEDGFYEDGKLIPTPKSTDHFLIAARYEGIEYSMGQLLVDVIYKKYFDCIVSSNKDAFIETFLMNIKRIVDSFEYNKIFTESNEDLNTLSKVMSLLDERFVDFENDDIKTKLKRR